MGRKGVCRQCSWSGLVASEPVSPHPREDIAHLCKDCSQVFSVNLGLSFARDTAEFALTDGKNKTIPTVGRQNIIATGYSNGYRSYLEFC